MRVGSRRVRVRQDDLDEFITAGSTRMDETADAPSRSEEPTSLRASKPCESIARATPSLPHR